MEASLHMQTQRNIAPPLKQPVFALAETMPVLVCRSGGAWVSGELEAWRWDRDGWSAFVRYTEVDSEERNLEWVPAYTVWCQCQDGKPAYPPDAALSAGCAGFLDLPHL